MTPIRRAAPQSGFGMIEVLVTLFILLVGLLGLAGVLVQSQRSELESYQRAQGLLLAQDMAARINMNRNLARCYAYTTNGQQWLGNGATVGLPPACSAAQTKTGVLVNNQVNELAQDLQDWNTLLLGAAETSNGNNVGAMTMARGCISYDVASELPVIDPLTGVASATSFKAGSGIYTVTVAWQGMADTTAPPNLNCAQNQYPPNDARRRAISYQFRLATLL